MKEVTLLIQRAREGDREAFDRIFELIYPELRQIAHRRLAGGARDGLMETTALVNECDVKFIQRKALTPTDRSHVLAYSATVTRSIIVDAARVAQTERRGGDVEQVTLDSELIGTLPAVSDEILARIDERLGRVVEMRYCGGMEDAEIAEALHLSTRTVCRGRDKARLLLGHALRN